MGNAVCKHDRFINIGMDCPDCVIEGLRKAEREVSDAYLRVRKLVGAFDTCHGGKDRFEVTERRIREIIKERDDNDHGMTVLLQQLDKANARIRELEGK